MFCKSFSHPTPSHPSPRNPTPHLTSPHHTTPHHTSPPYTTPQVTFLYKLCDGSSPKSYGINVARLAGLPQYVLDLAVKQSRAFAEKTFSEMERANASASAGEGEGAMEGVEEAAAVAVAGSQSQPQGSILQRDRVASVYDCLVSIVNMNVERMGQPAELDFAVREMWRRCVAANLALQG